MNELAASLQESTQAARTRRESDTMGQGQDLTFAWRFALYLEDTSSVALLEVLLVISDFYPVHQGSHGLLEQD